MKTPRSFLAAFLAVSVLTVAAFAADVSGKWKWTSITKTGGPSEVVADLQLKDGKLTGTVTGRQGPGEITAGTVEGNAISFTVIRVSGDQKVVFNYTGTLNGDTITGTIEKNLPPPAVSTKSDWKATRAK